MHVLRGVGKLHILLTCETVKKMHINQFVEEKLK